MTIISRASSRTKSVCAVFVLAAMCALAMAPANAASRIPVGTKFNVILSSPDINTKNAQPGKCLEGEPRPQSGAQPSVR